jgi:hypothetical protein
MILATSKVLHALGAKPRDRISSRIALRSSSLSALRQIAAVPRPRARRKCGYDKIRGVLAARPIMLTTDTRTIPQRRRWMVR